MLWNRQRNKQLLNHIKDAYEINNLDLVGDTRLKESDDQTIWTKAIRIIKETRPVVLQRGIKLGKLNTSTDFSDTANLNTDICAVFHERNDTERIHELYM